MDAARTQLAYGEWLRRSQRTTDARQHLRAAVETFQDLRAANLAARTTHELRASGETARKRDPSTLVKLTPTELQIAQLVSSGLSNKESPTSAGFHRAPSPSTCATSSPRQASPPAVSWLGSTSPEAAA